MESDSQPLQTKPKLFCFVLMPFSPDFEDIYEIGIKEACEAAGAYCERVDKQIFTERILDRIYNQIAKADLIVADMTGRNANVFYEVGYAHALGKPTVLLTKNADDIPFDLKHFPHIIYESKLVVLREGLSRVIKWHIDNPATTLAETGFPLSILIDGKNPSKEEVTINSEPLGTDQEVLFDVTIGNASTGLLSNEDYKVGIVSEKKIGSVDRPDASASTQETILADGSSQYILPNLRISLMPGEFHQIPLRIWLPNNYTFKGRRQVTLRLFTRLGFRDHIFYLQSTR